MKFDDINKHLIRILRRDVNFLKRKGLIDYSLLLAVELSAEKFKPAKLMKERLKYQSRDRAKSTVVGKRIVSENLAKREIMLQMKHFERSRESARLTIARGKG